METPNINHPPCKKCGDPVTVASWQYDRVCQSCLTALKKEPTPKNLGPIGHKNKRVASTQMHFDFFDNEKSLRALDL
jgi:hypothetical protein